MPHQRRSHRPSTATRPVRSGSAPLWRQVLEDLERRLAAGEFTDRFPTDRELVETYGVSRHTVRAAVGRLRARGIIDRYRGRGSFVRPDRVVQPAGVLYSLFREVERRGWAQRSEVLDVGEVRDPDVAEKLGLRRDTPLWSLTRLRYAGDEPLAVDTVWLPAPLGRELAGVDWRRTALYDELERRAGIRPTATEEIITPVVADADTAALLGIAAGEALFRIERRGFEGDRPFEYRITLLRGDRFEFVSQWHAAELPPPPRFEVREES